VNTFSDGRKAVATITRATPYPNLKRPFSRNSRRTLVVRAAEIH
jgi:hypothetical protein